MLGTSLEALANRLGDSIRDDPGAGPLEPIVVSVPARGLERWLLHALADRLRCVFDLRAPFPGDLVADLQALALGEDPEAGRDPQGTFRSHACWSKANLQLHLAHVLGRQPNPLADAIPGEPPPAGPEGALRRWDLAGSLAAALAEALEERPDAVREWEAAADPAGDLLARCWRLLREAYPDAPSAVDLRVRLAAIPDEALPSTLPRVVRVFAPSRLSAPQVDILWKIGAVSRVEVYALTPSTTYFGDLTARARTGTPFAQPPVLGEDDADQAPDGNPFLARSARPVAELVDLLIDRDFVEFEADTEEGSSGSGRWGRALDVIRSDMAGVTRSPAGSLEKDDRSIVVSNAAGILREVETLHDFLLECFATEKNLRPRDVLILAPDLDLYAPTIEAVFRSADLPELSLPFTLADRRLRASHLLLDAFLHALDLADSRFDFPSVLAWLERGPVSARYELSEDDFAAFRDWAAATGLAWGRDAEHRSALGLPADDHFSWRRTIDTLVLGLAVDGGEARLVGGLHPLAVSSGRRDSLARLLAALRVPFLLSAHGDREDTLAGWLATFRDLLVELAGPEGDSRRDLAALDDSLARLAALPAAGSDAPLPFVVVRLMLRELAEAAATQGSFLAGSISVAALQPMRAIPHRVIAVLGMNERGFPRPTRARPFSLLARERRRGDPSPRHADRQLFVEILLAARDRLFLSFQGRSAKDLSLAMPSIVVAELVEELAYLSGREKPEHCIRVEPLHRHDPRLFDASGPQAFGAARAAVAEALRRARAGHGSALGDVAEGGWTMPPLNEQDLMISTGEFSTLLSEPVRGFLEVRLGVRLRPPRESPGGEEPFGLDSLAWSAHQRVLVEATLQGETVMRRLDAMDARSLLPTGSQGKANRHGLAESASELVRRLGALDLARPTAERELDLELGGLRVRGRLGGWIDDARRVTIRHGKEFRATALFQEAALHALAQKVGGPVTTWLIAGESSLVLDPPDEADALLSTLATLARRALEAPLPLPTRSFHEAWKVRAEGEDAMAEKARLAFEDGVFGTSIGPEGDESVHRIFGTRLPDPGDLAAWVEAWPTPLLATLKEGES